MVRQTDTNDIPLIENIFYDVVFGMKKIGLNNGSLMI